jgi:hypothetical protein
MRFMKTVRVQRLSWAWSRILLKEGARTAPVVVIIIVLEFDVDDLFHNFVAGRDGWNWWHVGVCGNADSSRLGVDRRSRAGGAERRQGIGGVW